MTLVQAWLELDQEPVPAKTSQIERTEKKLILSFSQLTPEISAIAQGFYWVQSDSDTEFPTLFVCQGNSQSVVFRPTNTGCSIDENDLKTASFQAYYLEEGSESAIPIEIVDQITGKRQLILQSGGKADLSSDLVGKSLRLRVVYRSFVKCGEPIDTIVARLIERDESNKFSLKTYGNCKIISTDHIQRVCLDISEAIVNTQMIDL